jgi:hypothetical protein
MSQNDFWIVNQGFGMDHISATMLIGSRIRWTFWPPEKHEDEAGFSIRFSLTDQMEMRRACRLVADSLMESDIKWLSRHRDAWTFDATSFCKWLQEPSQSHNSLGLVERLDWLSGLVRVEPDLKHEHLFEDNFYDALEFTIYREEYLMDRNTKIFLSHKGTDKPMVEHYFETLKTLGFDPWLDKDAMPSGTELHRGMRQGLRDSCAAVFFITPHFRDEAYLRNEINWAIEEKTAKGDRFAIITLVFADEGVGPGSVPDLLHTYVWKQPQNELEGLDEIIRALPISLGRPAWKPGV